jgi:hypothetical protein
MPNPERPWRYLAALLGSTLAGLALLVCLPHDPYVRFQETKKDFSKARWIYERIHFDPAPLDVAFVGTSRTMTAVDDAALETKVKQGIANLAIRTHGRNMAYVTVKELLRERTPRRVVLELMEVENRLGHPMFSYLADRSDVLLPRSLLNDKLLEDWGRLPGRQASLFLKTAFPDRFHVQRAFSAASYAGSHSWMPEDVTWSDEELQALKSKMREQMHPSYLGERFAGLEYRLGYQYVSAIRELAEARGSTLTFLYLPHFQGPSEPLNVAFYRRHGDVWIPPREILEDRRNWSDASHLNVRGAGLLSTWLAERIGQ